MMSCDVTNAILEKSVKYELRVVKIIILWISRQLLNNNFSDLLRREQKTTSARSQAILE